MSKTQWSLPHRECGHSDCGQNFIDTGETRCLHRHAERYTEGPWAVERDGDVGEPTCYVVDVTGVVRICTVERGIGMSRVERNANARVLAAGPDMLKACRLALALVKDTWIEDHGSEQVGIAWGALETALAKAEGSL